MGKDITKPKFKQNSINMFYYRFHCGKQIIKYWLIWIRSQALTHSTLFQLGSPKLLWQMYPSMYYVSNLGAIFQCPKKVFLIGSGFSPCGGSGSPVYVENSRFGWEIPTLPLIFASGLNPFWLILKSKLALYLIPIIVRL